MYNTIIETIKSNIERLIYLVTEYGIIESNYLISNDRVKFIEKVHEGYYIAQEDIVEYLIAIEKFEDEKKIELKVSRKRREKREEAIIISKIKEGEFYSLVLRKIADTIAWSILKELHIVKQFYTGSTLIQLKSSNIESVKKYISQEKSYLESFCLITDITSFIQIGDILKIEPSNGSYIIKIIELKEGEVNNRIFQLFSNENCIKESGMKFIQEYGEKGILQIKRIVKQKKAVENTISLITNDKGYDPIFKVPKTISKETLELTFFVDKISSLFLKMALGNS